MEHNQLRLLFWETTQKCNLACSHCRMDVDKTYKELDFEQAKYLIDSIVEFSNPIFVLSGGEPLYREDIFDIAEYARSKGLRTALATNGTLVDQSVAQKIKESDIKRVSISIDDANAKAHDAFRNSDGAFDKAIRGINILVENGISTQINASLIKSNADQLEDMIKLAILNKTDAIHLFVIVPVGCGQYIDKSQLLSPQEYEEILKKIYLMSVKYKDEIFIKVTCGPQYYRILKNEAPEMFEKKSSAMHRISKGCLAGTGVCFISSTGSVYPCGYLPVEAGHIHKEKLGDIWLKSKVFQTLRDTKRLKENCKSCLYEKACGGCRARAYFAYNKDYMGPDPICVINA